MATAGPRYPGTTASEIGPSGDNNWISTSPITADDGTEAQITAATYDAGDHSYRLKATNFGFDADVPAGATINGITVEIDRRDFAGDAQDQEVRLYDSTATLVGDDKQTADSWPATLTIATYGGAADTWNAGLDAADIRSAGFGVALIVLANSANTDIGVDFIRVTVDYTAAPTSGTGAVSVPVVTVAGTGALVLTGTGAVTVPAATVAGTGEEVLTATGAVSVGAPTVAGTGDHTAPTMTGTGAVTVGAPTVSGVGAHPFTATGSVTVGAPTVAGTGELVLTATGAITGQAPTVAGSGAEILTGTGAVTVPPPTVAGAGDHTEGTPNPTGTGAIAVPSAAVVGAGAEVFTASGAITSAAPTVAGVGELIFTATGAIGVPAVLAVGSGALVLTGSGAIAVPVATIVGVGETSQSVTGTGAITAPAATVAGSGTGGEEDVYHVGPPGRRWLVPSKKPASRPGRTPDDDDWEAILAALLD